MPIERCANHCRHPYQDAMYGKGMRVMNEKRDEELRCTVCEHEQKQRRQRVEDTA